MLYEELLKHDPGRGHADVQAFNRWLDEDWGFAYQDRIFAAPYITLADVDWAVPRARVGARRGRPRDRDARRPRRSPTTGQRSRSIRSFDPFWARVDEAGITVVVHAGDSGYSSQRLRR